jgi:hypothetical protein
MNYAKLAIDARKLLKTFGASFTFTRITSTYNPTTGNEVPTTTTYSGYGVFGQYDQAQYSDTIQSGDVPMTLEAVSTEPQIGDTVAGYTVMEVAKTSPDNTTVVVYDIRLRR